MDTLTIVVIAVVRQVLMMTFVYYIKRKVVMITVNIVVILIVQICIQIVEPPVVPHLLKIAPSSPSTMSRLTPLNSVVSSRFWVLLGGKV